MAGRVGGALEVSLTFGQRPQVEPNQGLWPTPRQLVGLRAGPSNCQQWQAQSLSLSQRQAPSWPRPAQLSGQRAVVAGEGSGGRLEAVSIKIPTIREHFTCLSNSQHNNGAGPLLTSNGEGGMGNQGCGWWGMRLCGAWGEEEGERVCVLCSVQEMQQADCSMLMPMPRQQLVKRLRSCLRWPVNNGRTRGIYECIEPMWHAAELKLTMEQVNVVNIEEVEMLSIQVRNARMWNSAAESMQ